MVGWLVPQHQEPPRPLESAILIGKVYFIQLIRTVQNKRTGISDTLSQVTPLLS